MTPPADRPGAPAQEMEAVLTPFGAGQLVERVATLGREMAGVKDRLPHLVTHAEFQRSVRGLGALLLIVLAAVIGFGFSAMSQLPH